MISQMIVEWLKVGRLAEENFIVDEELGTALVAAPG